MMLQKIQKKQTITMKNNIPFIFFGTGTIASGALSAMQQAGLVPAVIVTTPDRPVGRKQILTASPVGQWATERGIETYKPEKLDEQFVQQIINIRDQLNVQCFAVIDYGTFLPKRLIDAAPHGILNMHPSLLPRLRGPSPIRSAILTDEKNTGITVMLVDEEMDHGPVVAQKKIPVPQWPPRGRELDELLSSEGGKLLAEILPLWVSGDIEAQPQNHDIATYCKQFAKEDGLLDLSADAYQNLLKIRAFDGWPGTYTFFEKDGKQIRVQVLDAHIENKKLILDIVKPEGKNEMPYADFARSGAQPITK